MRPELDFPGEPKLPAPATQIWSSQHVLLEAEAGCSQLLAGFSGSGCATAIISL